MLTIRTKWLDKPFTRRLRRHLADNQRVAGDILLRGIVTAITATKGSYSPPFHSQPGAVPFTITGEVARSFSLIHNRPSLYLMVFSDDPVARYLEYGTGRMVARPYFLRTLLA